MPEEPLALTGPDGQKKVIAIFKLKLPDDKNPGLALVKDGWKEVLVNCRTGSTLKVNEVSHKEFLKSFAAKDISGSRGDVILESTDKRFYVTEFDKEGAFTARELIKGNFPKSEDCSDFPFCFSECRHRVKCAVCGCPVIVCKLECRRKAPDRKYYPICQECVKTDWPSLLKPKFHM